MVNDHCVVHGVHLLMFVDPRVMTESVLRSTNLNESPIDELNTTLKLKHMLNKNYLFLLIQPSNLITYHLINA
jgi:hypothetical protein